MPAKFPLTELDTYAPSEMLRLYVCVYVQKLTITF